MNWAILWSKLINLERQFNNSGFDETTNDVLFDLNDVGLNIANAEQTVELTDEFTALFQSGCKSRNLVFRFHVEGTGVIWGRYMEGAVIGEESPPDAFLITTRLNSAYYLFTLRGNTLTMSLMV